MPETRRQAAQRAVAGNRLVYWGIAIGIFVLVMNLILSAYAASLQDQIRNANGELRLQEDSRDKETEKQLQAAQKQSRLMLRLLKNHVYWSEAFARIEQLMQGNVHLESINAAATGGTIQFSAVANNYAAVAHQLASFVTGDGVTDVTLSDAKVVPEGGIEFSGEIMINTKQVLLQAAEISTSEE